jgi:PKD domain
VSAGGPVAGDPRPRRLLVAAMLTALVLLGPRAAGVAQADAPEADFTFSPRAPLVGETVRFTATISVPENDVESVAWDLDDDGEFDDATGRSASTQFATAGGHTVTLQLVDGDDDTVEATYRVDVREAPPPGANQPPAPARAAPAPAVARRQALSLLSPFPIVRIVGTFVGSRVKITMLAVRAARWALVQVRCRGRGCPARRLSRRSTSYATPVRFRRLERHLPVGTVIEIFVTRRGRIGKYTRFVIRSGAAPLRRDACARADVIRPTRCPAS